MEAKRERPRSEDLVVRLQRHKGEIMKEEGRVKQQMKSFFRDLVDSIQSYEADILRNFDQEILNFHETAAKTINLLSKLKGNTPEETIASTEEALNCQLFAGTKVDGEKLKQLLREVYYLKIGTNHENSNAELPEMSESQFSMEEKMYSEAAVEKLQRQRDYYQRHEEELQQRLRELEMGRKGTNIRELSKSALEEKCSRWAIERLKEEKRVLVEKIGEASQHIMKQDGLLSEQQGEIRKLTVIVNQVNGKSMVANSSIKSSSIVIESEINHEREEQLQGKVTQLTLELTSCMHRLEEINRANKQYESQLDQKNKENQNLQYQIGDIKKENAMINNDYEAQLHKKAAIEQQLNQLKKNYDDLNAKLEEERQSFKSIVDGFEMGEKEIKQQLKRMEAEKKTEILLIQQKLISSQLQREKLLKKLDEVASKSGDSNNHKQLLNDEITRLLKENASMEKELHIKEENVFQSKEEARRLQLQIKQQVKKSQASKKQCASLKKANKQLEKQVHQLRNRLSATENTQLKILHIEQNISNLVNQFTKHKQVSDRRNSQHQKIVAILKERFTFQLTTLLEQGKKLKNQKQKRSEMVQKYIDEMITFSSKTAQIKQLKEEIRELKDKQGRQARQLKKRQKSNLEETVSALEWGLWEANNKIFEERLKNEKELFEERLAEMVEMCKKEETIKNSLAEQLQKQRSALAEIKNKQKQQKVVEDSTKNNKQLEEKVERLEQQIKRLKARSKKLEMQAADAQSQLKTKRELNAGLKNQAKMRQDTILQMSKQIDELKAEIGKQQRSTREISNKEQLLRQSKETQKKIQEEYRQLMESFEDLTEKNKQLIRQLAKKDEVIKQLGCIQEKQVKKKQDVLIRSLNSEIVQLKESVRKLKMDSDRKDQIIKNTKSKLDNKNKENEQLISRMQKQNDKIVKDKDALERKLQSISSGLKKQQMKSTNLCWSIKKIFEMCCQTPTPYQKQTSKTKPLTTQYYSNSTVSPHTLKLGTPASNIKSYISCEGLDILNLRPEDLQECLGMGPAIEATTMNKSQVKNESWSMVSPIINRRRQQQVKEYLMEGLEQLDRVLAAKEMNSAMLVEQFKKVLER